MKLLSLGIIFFTSSVIADVSGVNVSFTNEQMQQSDNVYSYEIDSVNIDRANVFSLDVSIKGDGQLTSQYVPSCTYWQSGVCVGPVKDILHTHFLHEAELQVLCDSKVLYKKIQNNSEFTNEEINSAESTIKFNYSSISLNPISCEQVKVNIRLIRGENDVAISGIINFNKSTSNNNSISYGVIQ